MNIKEIIEKYLLNHDIVNVLIAGSTCSGKTTLANELKEYFLGSFTVSIISQDDYFKDLNDIPRTDKGFLTDSIDAFCVEEFKEDVEILFNNKKVMMPHYLVETNTRIDKSKEVKLSQINIFDGLHTIEIFNELENSIKIYRDTDLNVCLQRRINRDSSKYGIPEPVIRRHFEECIMPMYWEFISPQKASAHFILN